MLLELRVRELGVIEDATLALGPGLTALTGETGAGKTLLVEALELLLGGRADSALVRAGADGAVVEGRFSADGDPLERDEDEIIMIREVPADGRSKVTINGRMATVAALSEIGSALVDLHGQHAQQSLLQPAAQREALDRYAGVDLSEVRRIEAQIAELDGRLAQLGGDSRAIAREIELLEFQLRELDQAALDDANEELALAATEDALAAAEELRRAADAAHELVAGRDDGGTGRAELGAAGLAAEASHVLAPHPPLEDLAGRLSAAAAELSDVADEVRSRREGFEDDPQALADVQARRRLLADLRRKYGDSLAEVIAFRNAARQRLDDLASGESRRLELESDREAQRGELAAAEEKVGDARRTAAPALSTEIEGHLATLALPKARLEVRVPPDGVGDAVEWLFGANAGEPALPLQKVASGGELARAMLATRLVVTDAPPTLVFDEVDAGIGGEAALAVGSALHDLARHHQVLVVTHLAQVAAYADAQIVVSKDERRDRTVASVRHVDGDERLTELSRMLSGQPSSAAARRHASELLAVARR